MQDQRDTHAPLIERLTTLGQIAATQTAVFQSVAASHYGLGITDMKALDVLTRKARNRRANSGAPCSCPPAPSRAS